MAHASANPFALDGTAALVTGGATGIGQAIAVALAGAGADVAVTVNTRPAGDTVAAVEAEGRRAVSLPCDLAGLDADRAEALLDEAERRLGPVQILVNNAGIIRRADAAAHTDADWDAVMDVNLNAVWRLSRAAGRRMLANGRGRIGPAQERERS